MNAKKPLIAITPGYDYENRMTYIKNGYIEGIIKAGGLPMAMPLYNNEDDISEIMDRCEGFLLAGGPDIDPRYYGEWNMPSNGEISPCRDYMEIIVAKKAIEKNKPLFGICRGTQILNVALGGTLYQDIQAQIKDRQTIKHSQGGPRWYPTHDICIERGSEIHAIFGEDRVPVNSFHHQAIKDVADELVITSRAPDGVIESVEHPEHIFAVGVQWHPELMWQENSVFLNLFRAFVEAAASF